MGWKGQLRLWLEHDEALENTKKRYVAGEAVESSERKKRPTHADRDAFRLHTLEAEATFGFSHEFFQGRSTLEGTEPDENAIDAKQPSPNMSGSSSSRRTPGVADAFWGPARDCMEDVYGEEQMSSTLHAEPTLKLPKGGV